jgi:tetratricopeptide (TPR) repeat protein
MDENLLRGIELVKAGDLKQAQIYLSRVVQSCPDSEEGWLWLGHALDDLEKRKYCYQRVLAINPANSQAWKALDDLYNSRPADHSAIPVQVETHTVEIPSYNRKSAEQQPAIKAEEKNVESGAHTSKNSALLPLLFGFFLALILLAAPAFFLIHYGLVDDYLLSSGMVALPPMPPVYPRPVDNVIVSTPIPIPTKPLSERMAQAEPLINQAKELISQQNYYDALPILNEVISIIPDVDEPYYLRAWCIFFLLNNQRSLDEHLSNVHAAVFDLDKAIDIRPDIGNYHALRGLMYSDWAGLQELTVNRNALYDIALQNFINAKALGFDILSTPDLTVIVTQIQMGECEKGLEGIDSALENSNLSSQSVSNLYFNQANAYSCLGKLDEALEAINQSMQYSDVTGEQKTLEAAILYQQGKPDEALKILDNLIVQSPNYGGDRYLLRALIVFEQGDWDETYRSMLAGGGNVWLHGGLYSYVQGKMGLQLAGDENRAKSIDSLQYAEASMPVTFNVLKARIQTEIVELGNKPWDLSSSFAFQPTTVAEILPRLTPRPTSVPLLTETPAAIVGTPGEKVTVVPTSGTSTPDTQGALLYPREKDIIIVDFQTGTGSVNLPAGTQEIFRFQPASALSFSKIMDVVIHLNAEKSGLTPPLLYELWNPQNRTWISIEPGWTDTDILYPGDYVLPEGDVYLSVRNLGSVPFRLNNLSITVVFQALDGNLMQYGTK